MSVVAEFSIEADEFLLGQLIAEFPDLSVEVERIVPAKQRVMPYIWGYGSDLEEFVQAHPNVKSITVLDRFDDAALYKIEWDDPAEQLIGGIADTDATILEAHSDEQWTFRIRFGDRSALAAFNEYCRSHGIDCQLERVSTIGSAVRDVPDHELTAPQAEALRSAVARGYFEVPRRVTFAELAADLDISEQAVSERVRRGAAKVLRAGLDL